MDGAVAWVLVFAMLCSTVLLVVAISSADVLSRAFKRWTSDALEANPMCCDCAAWRKKVRGE